MIHSMRLQDNAGVPAQDRTDPLLREGGGSRPVDLPYVLALLLVAGFAAYAFASVHFGIRDGGMGDDSHRLLIAYRLIPDLSPTWTLFLDQPWPPLPYILQVLTHRALRITVGISDRQFIQSAILCSITLYGLHLMVALEACRRLGSNLAGLFYVAGAISAGSVIILAVSAMAEAPAFFFLSLAALLLTFDRSLAIGGAGLMFLAASLSRSEIAVFGLLTSLIVLFRYGVVRAVGFAAIALAAAGIKTIYTLVQSSGGMSYLNLGDFYWVGDSVQQRLGYLLDGLIAASRINIVLVYLLILLVPALILKVHARRQNPKDHMTTEAHGGKFAIGVTTLGIASVTFITLLCALGKIAWDVRYELLPLSITYLGVCVLASGDGSVSRRQVGTGVAGVNLTMTVLVFLAGAFGAVESLKALEAVVPIELRQARDVTVQNTSPNKLLAVDALKFWDTYPLVHAVIDAGAMNSACVYDFPQLLQTAGMQSAVTGGESRKTINFLAYIDQYEPALLAAAGPEWRPYLDSITRFMDHEERSSYVLPSITWQNEVDGELSLSKIGSNKRFRVTRIYENAKVRLYRLARIAE
jgi:hypothetical protein